MEFVRKLDLVKFNFNGPRLLHHLNVNIWATTLFKELVSWYVNLIIFYFITFDTLHLATPAHCTQLMGTLFTHF